MSGIAHRCRKTARFCDEGDSRDVLKMRRRTRRKTSHQSPIILLAESEPYQLAILCLSAYRLLRKKTVKGNHVTPVLERRSAASDAPRPKAAKRPSLDLSRTTINFLLDTALLVAFLAIAWISVVLRFVFPAGTAAAGWRLWGYGFDDWSAFQFSLLCVFALGVLVHLMLHWSWVCGVVASRMSRWRGRSVRVDEGTQTLYGVGLLIVAVNVVGLLIAAAALSVRMP
jgi:hypothetical protein